VALSASESGAAAEQLTLKVENDEPPSRVDLGEPGPSIGDMLVWSSPVVEEASNDAVGESAGACTQLTQEHGLYSCLFTLKLPDGDLAISGLWRAGLERSELAAVGGTGAY
jgi:hypothetical protein